MEPDPAGPRKADGVWMFGMFAGLLTFVGLLLVGFLTLGQAHARPANPWSQTNLHAIAAVSARLEGSDRHALDVLAKAACDLDHSLLGHSQNDPRLIARRQWLEATYVAIYSDSSDHSRAQATLREQQRRFCLVGAG